MLRYNCWMSINMHEITRARASITETAQQMLAGDLSYIEGSRTILAVLPEARIGNMDEFMAFAGINSETDKFPFGDVRKRWQPEALTRMQPELDRAEQWAKAFGEPACRAVIERFRNEPFGEL